MRRYLWFAATWTPGLSLLFHLALGSLERPVAGYLVGLVIAEVTMSCCYWGATAVSAAERWVYARRGWRSGPRSAPANIARAALFLFPGLYLGFAAARRVAPYLGVPLPEPGLDDYRSSVLYGLGCSALFVALEMRQEASLARERAARQIRELENAGLRAQIAALTAQMNPHLLFNTLNSIAAMIDGEPAAAERMTVGLASLYRRVLAAARRETHSLADELALVGDYLEIERGRFGARLAYWVELAPDVVAAACPVPVLCLQPFVENAVKHGLLGRSVGGRLWVRARAPAGRLELTVEDDGVGLGGSRLTGGSGTAVSNCRTRLALLYGAAGEVELGPRPGGGTLVTLRLPLAEGGR